MVLTQVLNMSNGMSQTMLYYTQQEMQSSCFGMFIFGLIIAGFIVFCWYAINHDLKRMKKREVFDEAIIAHIMKKK